ncbi:MAG: hypothetical protein HC906_04455 [Bacteroidales bacterium]|nr:hypothetical protein [Bacteroidales bacterium]
MRIVSQKYKYNPYSNYYFCFIKIKIQMTGKDRIKATLAGESTDRFPYVPCIDKYTQAGFQDPIKSMDLFELQKYCCSDMFRGLSSFSIEYTKFVKHTQSIGPDGSLIDEYKTPLGTLREVHRFTPESPYIPFPTEYLIKNVK